MSEYKRLTTKGSSYTNDSNFYDTESINELYGRLENLETKIENGTLIELPCKVGDTLWRWLYGNQYDEWTVYKINVYVENGRVDYTLCCTSKCGCGQDYFYKDDKDIEWCFEKPKAEAEARLKELKNE